MITDEDKSDIYFNDAPWINLNGLPRLDNVLDYFSFSSFYDRQSTNEYCKMQKINYRIMPGRCEYSVAETPFPYLLIIHKHFRETETRAIPVATYYCINGSIYQAPNIHSVLSCRMTSSLYYLKQAFLNVLSKSRFHTHQPYTWDFGKSIDS
eukprot:TRINITY_DN5366_c0_g1_i2.p1 TRINITY_DN5366_c0_g1~~TRINITY_DN5366_c0_g1_i2.p1  ORF type:complete len:152 (+),score=16.52 TRINITY_DN5366_c0_g1_i2:36-491(+)